MRPSFIIALAGFLLFAAPAVAGSLTAVDGKATWQSTQCTAPTPPPSLALADSETPAEDMNTRIAQYNQYVELTQIYMTCISDEAEKDAIENGQIIIHNAQDEIEKIKADLDRLGEPLKAKE